MSILYLRGADGEFYPVEAIRGPAGKSAYAYAQDGGFKGSESEFADQLANAQTTANEANQKVDTLRAVVSKFHSNIVEEASGEVITISDSAEAPLQGLKVFGKTTQNGTPTPEAPVPLESVGDDGSVAVTVCGKNFASSQKVNSQTKNGITFTLNDDGSVSVHGTPTTTYVGIEGFTVSVKAPGRYVLSGGANTSGKAYFQLRIRKADGSEIYVFPGSNGEGKEFQLDGTESLYATLTCGNYTAPVDCKVYPMIRMASVADATYEPYNGQTLTISTPNGLPGIPVTSGGNYTDGNGQQWLCDEVDFEKGVYIQRLKSIALKGTESIILWNASKGNFNFSVSDLSTTSDAILCSHLASKPGSDIYGGKVTNAIASNKQYRQIGFAIDGYTTVDSVKAYLASEYSNGAPVVILYVLNSEKTTALSAEQLAAFAELHTNYPSTTIYNDDNADMDVKYIANTKIYIDKKFAELAAAIINNT